MSMPQSPESPLTQNPGSEGKVDQVDHALSWREDISMHIVPPYMVVKHAHQHLASLRALPVGRAGRESAIQDFETFVAEYPNVDAPDGDAEPRPA